MDSATPDDIYIRDCFKVGNSGKSLGNLVADVFTLQGEIKSLKDTINQLTLALEQLQQDIQQ